VDPIAAGVLDDEDGAVCEELAGAAKAGPGTKRAPSRNSDAAAAARLSLLSRAPVTTRDSFATLATLVDMVLSRKKWCRADAQEA
jgi:hypothetical protein